ncbi:MAG TPA: mechanosensitive ion channel domain-containing protein [Stellaceae bacterium]|nr:mechanosensitive ion channel domain-containing protein [Stellaceae bacterium]
MKARSLIRFAAALMFCLAPVLGARAQSAPAAPTNQELQHLVATLEDDKARAQLVQQLQALIAAQNAQQQQQEQETSPLSWFGNLPAQLDSLGADVLSAVPIFTQAPRLFAWLDLQIADPQLRGFWIDVITKLALIFGAGLAAGAIVRLVLRPAAARLGAPSRAGPGIRLLILIAAAIVEALPVLAFAGAAIFVLPFTKPHLGVRSVAEVLITATVWARGLLAAARIALISPGAQGLYPLGDETRNYLYIWLRRFVHWAAYGYAASVGSWWIGAPGTMDGLLMRITVLILAIFAIIFILQNRIAVRDWLRGNGPADANGWRVLRNRIGDTWHIVAIIYVVGTFGVYVLDVSGGFTFLLRATALSAVVVTAALILARVLERLLQRGFAVRPELKARFPALESRVNRYTAILRITGAAIIYALAALAVLQAWGIDAFVWIEGLAAQPATGSALSLVFILVGGVALWELFNSVIERRLAGIDLTRRSRARTLLPLLRTSILILFITIAGLMILSQLGLNIAPLLAGAGVAGIAIGFGAQTLVKDLITGFFILLEDAFAVGDVVDVGDNHAGVVEAISMRNFRLRDQAGTVHTVPFGIVTTIKNLTRDFAYFVADVEVSYREDTDAVVEVLTAVAEEMRKEPAFSYRMLEPIEIIGVDAFKESSVVIKVRLKTLPIQQWTVGREFNRRMKKAFDKAGIEMPFPHRTIYFGEDKGGAAPPARIRMDQAAESTRNSGA